jgi:hypothetical protein
LKAAGPEVTLKVALTLVPGATGPAKVVELEARAVHPLGAEILTLTSVAETVAVFVKVRVVSWDEPGEKVCSPGGVVAADAGARLTCATS